MRGRSRSYGVIALLGVSLGCARQPPLKPPVAVTPPAPVSPEGTWQSIGRSGTMRMILKPGGGLIFQGGLEYFNPGEWDWNPARKELTITLPRADDKKLEVFQLYVGDGVKYFDPRTKTVAYYFDDQTENLNVAGWSYSKASTEKANVTAEPVLK